MRYAIWRYVEPPTTDQHNVTYISAQDAAAAVALYAEVYGSSRDPDTLCVMTETQFRGLIAAALNSAIRLAAVYHVETQTVYSATRVAEHAVNYMADSTPEAEE